MTDASLATGPEAPPEPLGLRRSRRKVIAGVCEGAGQYFGIDPVVFRIVLAVLAVTGGIGLIAYGFAWLVVRQDGEEQSEAHRLLSGRVEGTALTAVLTSLVGSGLFLSMLGNSANQAFSLVLLAALAGTLFWSRQRRRDGETVDAVTADAPPAAQPPPTPIAPSWWREPLVKDPPGGYLWGPDDGPHADALRRVRRPARRRESTFGFFLVPFALLAAGTGVVASWWSQPLGTSLEIGLTAALAVLGLGLVISAWAGRARSGTVVAALITGALLLGAADLPKSIGTEWTRTEWSPTAVAQLRPSYEEGTGRAELDLTGLALDGRTVSSRISVGAGQLVVRLPADASVRLSIDVGLGDIQLPGEPDDDIDVQPDIKRTTTLEAADGRPSGTIDLDLEIGLGQVKVIR